MQPQNQTVSVGADVSFSVSVSGFEPFSFQWRWNDVVLAAESNATLTLTNVQFAQAGSYAVIITDAIGDSTLSEDARLTILSGFTRITNGPVVKDGGSSYGCAWGDYDNDGFIDLIVGNGWGQHNFLYRNNRDGTFTKVTAGPVVEDVSDSDAVVWGDYDNDGFIDLFVANWESPQEDSCIATAATGLSPGSPPAL
jgi:hypothetical protein